MNKAARTKRAVLDPRCKYFPLPDPKPNKADHKAKAAKKKETADFTGLSPFKTYATKQGPGSSRGTGIRANKKKGPYPRVNRRGMEDALDAEKMAEAAAHHVHPRHKRKVKPRTKKRGEQKRKRQLVKA